MDRQREQRSREYGIKLAKALRDHAAEASKGSDVNPRCVMLGAADYLRETAEFRLNPPLDDTAVDPHDRRD